jgi:hypothetical protein
MRVHTLSKTDNTSEIGVTHLTPERKIDTRKRVLTSFEN